MEENKKNTCCDYIKNKYNKFKLKCGTYYDNLKPYIRLSLEFSKIILGCLLFIFVPQVCKGPNDYVQTLINNYNINITLDNIRRPCTLQDNFFDINDYKIFIIVWNFLTLFTFLINFCWEIKRERYIQSHFEYTIKKPITDIKNVFTNNNKLNNSYHTKTKVLYYLNYACFFMILTNILFTSIMIYKYYYDGFRSITGLITCVILIFQKLYYNYDTLNISLKEGYVLSTSLTKPHDFNTLEPIKFKQNEYLKRHNTNKSYRIYYLGKEKENDVEGDKFVMQNSYNEFTPIFIETNNKNKLNKLAREKIKEGIKNEIRCHNIDMTIQRNNSKKRRLNSDTIQDISECINNQIMLKKINEVEEDEKDNNTNDKIHDEIHNIIHDEIHNKIHDEIHNKIHDEIHNKIHDEIHNKIPNIENEISNDEIHDILEKKINVLNKIKLQNTQNTQNTQNNTNNNININDDMLLYIIPKNIEIKSFKETSV
jgi:hypothetical protein